MDNKGRRRIVKKGEKIKQLLEDHNSILIYGEAECGKSLLCGYLENSLKEEPFVVEINEKRKQKLQDLSKVDNEVILIDNAHNISIDSLINNLSLSSKKIILFSRDNKDFIGELEKKVSLIIDFNVIDS
jgi:ABC-type transport system involved in cytochrome bd biosynthesis fused ATPase/permease subunit